MIFRNELSFSSKKLSIYRLTRWKENEGGTVEKKWDWFSRNVKINITFCQFWWLKIPLNGWEVSFLNEIMQQKYKRKIDTLKKELTAVLLKENELERRAESRLSDFKNFWRFHFQESNARSGLIVSWPTFLPRVETFVFYLWWNESSL